MLGSVQVGLGGSELECAWISGCLSLYKILLVGKVFKKVDHSSPSCSYEYKLAVGTYFLD